MTQTTFQNTNKVIDSAQGASVWFHAGRRGRYLLSLMQAVFNLYVLHDPMWRPTYEFANLDAFILSAADRAEWLVKK